MQRPFATFLGVDLGGGKGKHTAVARLRVEEGIARVQEVGTRSALDDDSPFFDEVLCAYLERYAERAVLAVNAPLTVTACMRCRLPECLTVERCNDPTIVWFREDGLKMLRQSNGHGGNGTTGHSRDNRKPMVTPYTQRACEITLQTRYGIQPRETLGQGMGPLTSRAAYLRRALEHRFQLGHNLIEVYPKATLAMLFGKQARRYKRHPDTWYARAQILEALSEHLRFDIWREGCLQNDHHFDAVVSAYTAYLWARDGWQLPDEHRDVYEQDGWIWLPPAANGK